MQLLKNPFILSLFCLGLLIPSAAALAYSPSLNLSVNGDNVTISLSGAPANSQIQLSYTEPGSSLPTTVSNFGTTDYNGNFTTTVSANAYGLSSGAQVYVTVGGQQSNIITFGQNNGCGTYGCGGCTYNCGGSSGSLSLSQTSLSLNSGQTVSVTVYNNNYGGTPYVSGNSNPSVATASFSGSVINVYGQSSGSTTMQICVNNGQCASLYVTVNGGSSCGSYGCVGGLTLSQTNVSLNVGQTSYVTASMPIYNQTFYISSNSNSGVVSASVSGTQISLYGLTSGSSTISVCSSGGSACASVYVTVGGGSCAYSGCSGSLSLSQTSVNLNVGQNSLISIYNNYGGAPYISSNSNSGVASASISGSSLNIYGSTPGSTTIIVCASGASSCASAYVTVGGSSTGGNIWFSPTTATMYSGQSLAVSISSSVGSGSYYSGSNAYYISSNGNPSVVSASISGTVLNLSANQSGSTTITVCLNSLSLCGIFPVTVNGGSSSGSLSLSQTSVNLNIGQSLAITAYNYNGGSLYVSSNSNSGVAYATLSGSTVNVYGQSNGSATLSICAYNSSQCASLYVTVGSSSGGGNSIWFSPSTVNLNYGQSQAVTIYSNNYANSYYISSNSNSGAVSPSISGSTLNLYGEGNGTSTITVCQSSYSNCGTLYVTVGSGGGSNGSSIWFSPSTVNINYGQSAAATIYSNYTSYSYYVSSNSNPSVASASVSGSTVNLYGQGSGSTTVTVCQSNNSNCGTLYVTVGGGYGGGGSGSLYFNTTSLPLMTIGQYYSYQLQAYGGTPPYTYNLISGNLPYGLSLSPNGLISGVPTANLYTTFQVSVNDSYGHNATASFSVNNNSGGCTYNCGGGLQYPGGGTSGTVGSYPSGELISEGSTVYIVYRNLQTPFANAAAFLGLGFNFSNVVPVGNSGLTDSGYVVASSRVQHPWGSWVKSGTTVYFVDETGLIPVPSWSTFISNGGQQSFIVPANYWDLRLPQESVMVVGDSRLQ